MDELDCNVKSGPSETIGSESAIVDAGLEGKSAVVEATRKAKTRDFRDIMEKAIVSVQVAMIWSKFEIQERLGSARSSCRVQRLIGGKHTSMFGANGRAVP